MTNPTPHGQVPEALRLAALLDAEQWPGSMTLVSYARACVAELRRLHAENETLRTQQPASPPTEQPQPHYSRLHDADAVHGKQLSVYSKPPAEQQAASSAVLKAIREANMQLVRTGDDAFMLVPYKVAKAQAAESVQDLHSVNDAVTIELLNERVAYLEGKLSEVKALSAAPGPVSDTQHSQFLSDVLTAAGLITHGKRCKALGERLSDMVMRLRAASPTPPAEQQARWVERWHGSGGKEFWEGWSILNAANREMIAHLGPDVDPDAVRGIVAAHNEALCGECAGTGGRWCPACAGATPPAEQQATKETSGGFHVWRDISTAPKDGSRFVATGHNYGLYSEGRHVCIAQWFRGCWMEASDWNETSELKYLTHWMPLPPLPGNAARKQGGA